MKLISIDPSSTRTGVAVFRDGDLTESFALRSGARQPWQRIRNILIELERELQFRVELPDAVIIEVGKKPHAKKRQSMAGAGLITYGMAVGAVCRLLDDVSGHGYVFPVEHIDVNEWTKRSNRQIPKYQRLAELAVVCPQYNPEDDPGGDIGDAIAMGLWWLERKRVYEHA